MRRRFSGTRAGPPAPCPPIAGARVAAMRGSLRCRPALPASATISDRARLAGARVRRPCRRASPMTYGTIRQSPLVDVVFAHEPFAQCVLVLGAPGHAENFVARSQVLLRIAMAIQAPLHRQRRGSRGQRHLVYTAVAGLAADAFRDVDRMIEVD